ncbi:MAG: efflux RND transporter permease subunit, partial [Paracoccaceae bacterium]
VAGRMSRMFEGGSTMLRRLPWLVRAALVPPSLYLLFIAAMQSLNPGYLFGGEPPFSGFAAILPGAALFLVGAVSSSITLGAAKFKRAPKQVQSGYRRTPFGVFTKFIAGNPIMPIVSIVAIGYFVVTVFTYFGENNRGVEFFVESETEQAIIYVRARGNLSVTEKDVLVRQVEKIILDTDGIESVFAFAGSGGLNQNTGGASGPRDAIGQIQIELTPWEHRKDNPDLDGDVVIERLNARLAEIPGIRTESLSLSRGPASGKPVALRLKGENWADLKDAVEIARTKFERTAGLIDIEDTLPLPGIDWQINVDVEKAGRFGADVATVGGMVQLVTRGILLDTMRIDSSDEEIEIRVRLPKKDRVLSTLDTLKVRTRDGLVPLSNFITREPVAKLGQIDRTDQKRYFDIKAAVSSGLTASDGTAITAEERRMFIGRWLDTEHPLPAGISYEWTGDMVDQAESQEFLQKAFLGALGLMFVILLAQFNSFYNATLVLMAVVLSTTGVLIGMLVMKQPFSIIMTGTGIVALAGIVVNNNIVLIDTYQEYSKYMPRIEAIVRTAEARIRPVLLTTITTMAGLAPMMFGLSLDFLNGGYSINSPTALWWKQLATAVVFGLGIATVLTLIFTPSMLALRVWVSTGAYRSVRRLKALSLGSGSAIARDLALQGAANTVRSPEIIWDVEAVETPKVTAVVDSVDFVETGAEALDAPGERVDLPDIDVPSIALVERAKSADLDPPAKTARSKRKPRSAKKPPLRAAE